MSPVVQIIAGKSVLYSLNNGINMLEFEDGEYYEVPDHVASGMIARNWAKLATPDPTLPDPPKEAPPPPPVQEPHPEPKPKPQGDENGDDDSGYMHDGEEDPSARHALRTKSKRR